MKYPNILGPSSLSVLYLEKSGIWEPFDSPTKGDLKCTPVPWPCASRGAEVLNAAARPALRLLQLLLLLWLLLATAAARTAEDTEVELRSAPRTRFLDAFARGAMAAVLFRVVCADFCRGSKNARPRERERGTAVSEAQSNRWSRRGGGNRGRAQGWVDEIMDLGFGTGSVLFSPRDVISIEVAGAAASGGQLLPRSAVPELRFELAGAHWLQVPRCHVISRQKASPSVHLGDRPR